MAYVVHSIVALILICISYITGCIYIEGKQRDFKPDKNKMIYIICAAILSIAAILFINMAVHMTVIEGIKVLILVTMIFAVAIIDYKVKKIPNIMLIVMLVMRLAIYVFEFILYKTSALDIVKDDLLGVLIVGGFFLIIGLAIKNSVGMGDIKLFAIIGLYQGFSNAFSTVFFALVVSSVISIILLISRKKHRKDTIPFAPCVFIGMIIEIILAGI